MRQNYLKATYRKDISISEDAPQPNHRESVKVVRCSCIAPDEFRLRTETSQNGGSTNKDSPETIDLKTTVAWPASQGPAWERPFERACLPTIAKPRALQCSLNYSENWLSGSKPEDAI
jgi:hypothetical protein